jgi:hypothetical protein
MLGGCEDETGQAVGPLLIRVAEKFPEAVRFPFQFTYEHIFRPGADNPDVKLKPYVYQLQQKLQSGGGLLDRILSGLSNLCMPEIKASDFLASMQRTFNSLSWVNYI